MSEHVIPYTDESGEKFLLDINSGRRYDAAGNELSRWQPTNNEHSALLADYVAEKDAATRAYALKASAFGSKKKRPTCLSGHTDPGRRIMLSRGKDDPAVLMDLGTSDVHQPAALPNFASGYSNEPPIADMYAPPLLTAKPSDKYYQFAKEDAFQTASPIAGASGAQVAEIAPRLTNASFTTEERALGGFVSTQLEAAQDAALRVRQATADRVLQALLIMRELRVATLAQTSGTWDSSVVTTLGAGFQWNGGTNSDPVKDIHTQMDASWGPVTGLIMSRPTYHAFVRNAAVRGYYAYKDAGRPIPSPAELQALLDLPTIYVGKMQYIDSTGAKSYVWGNHVVLVRQPAELPPMSQRDVASAYTFRWNAVDVKDGVSSGGFIVREYFVQDRGSMGGNKIVIIHHDAEVQTSKFVGGLILNAYQ